ncbi:hypothetical protein [Taibaiella lutea]|nr:hypothetical protein [Taibaiella lutea]
MSAVMLNTFWDIIPPMIKQQVLADYESYGRQQQSKQAANVVGNRFRELVDAILAGNFNLYLTQNSAAHYTINGTEASGGKIKYAQAESYLGINVYEKQWMQGGITLPPFGIIVEKYNTNTALKQHEYGHKLNYDENGFTKYYRDIAILSLYNTFENKLDKWSGSSLSIPHKYYFSETDANTRAQEFFGPTAPINNWPNNSQTREAEYPVGIRAMMYAGWGITVFLGMSTIH